MSNISLGKLHELYKDTLDHCGTYLLNENDEIVEYNLFEEFDVGVISFLHKNSLVRLLGGGLITEFQMEESEKLRKMVLNLQNENEWNIASVRTSKKWKQLLELADEIRSSVSPTDE